MTFKNNRKLLLFCDFNGVISYKDFWWSLSDGTHEYSKFKPLIEDMLFKKNTSLIREWMLGATKSENVCKYIADSIDGVEFTKLFNILKDDCKNIDISKKIMLKLKDLKTDFYLVLSTGNMDCFNRFTLKSNPLLKEVFDEIDNSCDIGMFKSTNHGQYFKDKIECLGVPESRSFVIDDSKKVCDIFSVIGGKSFNCYGENEVLDALNIIHNEYVGEN